MVARINFVKSIGDVLHYHEKKVEVSGAKLLFASGFPAEAERLTGQTTRAVFEKLTCQNIRSNCNALHVSLNFLKEDQLSAGKMVQISRDYMKAVGFGGQPFLVYQHFDAGHPHIHVASVIIQEGGQRIATHNLAYQPSRLAAMEIEQVYGLVPSGNKLNRQQIQLESVPLHRLHYGEVHTWRAISSVVSQVIRSYNCCSLPQLNTVLNQFGIRADGGRPGSRLHANRGLVYYLLDERGDRVGRAIKSSDIYGAPTLKQLQRRFLANELDRGSFAKRLSYHLDKVLTGAAGQHGMEAILHKQGIRMIINKDPEGKVVGAVFIDNGARAVFNDWELGEKYQYQELQKRVQIPDKALEADLRAVDAGMGITAKSALAGTAEQNKEAIALMTHQRPSIYSSLSDSSSTETESQAEIQLQSQSQSKSPSQSQNQLYPGSELPVIEIMKDYLYYDNNEYKNSYLLSQQISRKEELGLRM